MKLKLVTWTLVMNAGAPPACSVQAVSRELEALLSDHVGHLLGRIEKGTTPAAEFVADEFRARFNALASGTPSAFVHNASQIATALQSRMDGRTPNGLLVAARLTNDGVSIVGVFKLDITDKYAGSLLTSAGGTQMLRVIRDLLETPGKLQKGAVIPDPRPESAVVVGDKLADTAQYFLDALGIRQVQRASQSHLGLVRVVAEVVGRPAEEVLLELQRKEVASAEEFVRSLPDVSREKQDEALRSLEGLKRPIRQVDPKAARAVRKTLRASGITITGPFPDISERVSITQRLDGKWQVTIIVDEQPSESFE